LFASLSLIFGVTAAAAGQEDGSSYWDRNLGLRSVTRGTWSRGLSGVILYPSFYSSHSAIFHQS